LHRKSAGVAAHPVVAADHGNGKFSPRPLEAAPVTTHIHNQ